MEEKRELWERQPHEASDVYADFCVYRDLGPSRTLRKAAEITGKQWATLCQTSRRHKWVKRVEAYDDYIDRENRKTMERNIMMVKRSSLTGAMKMAELGLKKLNSMKPEELTVGQAKDFMRNALAIAQAIFGESQAAEDAVAQMTDDNDVVVYLPEIDGEVVNDKEG